MSLLRVSGLRLGYGRGPDVVHNVTLSLDEGETIAILGPSGGGKSTLLKAVAGLLPPRSGELEVLGAKWPSRPTPGSVGYVPQRLGLVRHATVLENVVQGGLHATSWTDSLLRRAPAAVTERAHAAIKQLGLSDKTDAPVHTISGGQQRRTAVARALVQRPRLLLADEFLGELDPATMAVVVAAVKDLQRETGMGLLIVEHHLDQALLLSERLFRLKGGDLTGLEQTR